MRTTPRPLLDVEEAIPELRSMARTTIRLHPRRGKRLVDESKLGGMILWPRDEEWPRCDEHDSAYVTVLQLRSEDVAEIEFPIGKDLLQLLWCPNHHVPLCGPTPRIFWRNRAELVDRLAARPKPTIHDELQEYVPRQCVLHPERVVEFPHVFEISDDLPELMNAIDTSPALIKASESITEFDFADPSTLYQFWLSVADGTKIGGYPNWVQNPEWSVCRCGTRMDYLLTIASSECDGGTWGRWLATEDREAWNDPEIRDGVTQAASIMLGDGGDMNVFVCRQCLTWPIVANCQCS